MLIIKFDGLHIAHEEKIQMEPDNHGVHIDMEFSQAALLLKRLETLRDELGVVGEDLINLLRSAGVAPLAEPDSAAEEKPGTT
jgi:hypothetical protein